MLDCVLISADEGLRHTVLGLLRRPNVQARLAVDLQTFAEDLDREGLGKILRAVPKVAFLDLGQTPSGVGGIQVVRSEAPDLALIVAGPALSAEGLLAVMRAGADEYLPRPVSQEDVLEAFDRVKRRVRTGGSEVKTAPGKVTTVFSAKGGVGVTLVATNLAIAFQELTGKGVLLLDLAPMMGTAGVAMGLHPRYSYLDVIRNFHRIDEELFLSFLEVHESGVSLLASPLTSDDSGALSVDDFHGLVSLCRKQFEFVVVDGGSALSHSLTHVLGESDERVVVVTPDLPALRNMKHALDIFGRLHAKGPPKVVLNQFKEGFGLSAGDVEEGLGQRLAAVLEKNDVRVIQSINLGRPEVLTDRSKLSRGLMALAGQLLGSDKLPSGGGSLLSRFFGTSKGNKRSAKEAQ